MIRQFNLDMDEYRGLSTDTKPSGIANGVIFLEIDTGAKYMYDEENDEWYPMPGGSGLSDNAKQALLDCFEHVAWIDDQGQTYYDALYSALHDGLASISAVYTQSGNVYTTDTLDDLKPDLVVTATYGDSTTRVVTGYALSGTLAEGTSTITVTYLNTSDTFNVTVTDGAHIEAVFTQPQTPIYVGDAIDGLKSNLVVTYYTLPGEAGTVIEDSAYTLSGTLTDGTSVITVEYQNYTTTFNVLTSLQTLLGVSGCGANGAYLTSRNDRTVICAISNFTKLKASSGSVETEYSPIMIPSGASSLNFSFPTSAWVGAKILSVDGNYYALAGEISYGNASTGSIDISSYADGTYFLYVFSNSAQNTENITASIT